MPIDTNFLKRFASSANITAKQIYEHASNPLPFLIDHGLFNDPSIGTDVYLKAKNGEKYELTSQSQKDIAKKKDIHLRNTTDGVIAVVTFSDFLEMVSESEIASEILSEVTELVDSGGSW